MPTVRSRLLPAAAILASAALVVTSASPVWAKGFGDKPGRGATPPPGKTPETGGGAGDGNLWAHAGGVSIDESKNGSGSAAGPVAPVGNYSPPACWYAPQYGAKDFKKYAEGSDNAENHAPGAAGTELTGEYGQGDNPYHVKDDGKGYWWTGYVDPSQGSSPDAGKCSDPLYMWVKKGATPKTKNAITPRMLAEIAYAHLKVPSTKVDLNPTIRQTVNLPTWVWLDKAKFHEVSVTATADTLGISATTTAKPKSLHIDPGTSDASTFPDGGDCPIGKDGSIGTPYHKGAKGDPPCGILYQHASNNGPFPMKATLTWEISWTGTTAPGRHMLDPGTFGTTRDVNVQEVQSVVSGTGN